MDREHLANTALAMLITLTTWALWSVGEGRVDAYISAFTVEYLAVKSVLRPRKLFKDLVAVILVLIFTFIVAIKVYEVLSGVR